MGRSVVRERDLGVRGPFVTFNFEHVDGQGESEEEFRRDDDGTTRDL